MYHCVGCSAPSDTLVCSACHAHAESARKTSVPVLFCHYCGKDQDQGGTECQGCETARKMRVHGAAKSRKREKKTTEAQLSLW